MRPEHVVIGGAGGRDVTVQRAVYQGGHAVYTVEIAGRSCTVVDGAIHRRGIVRAGSRIPISLADAPVWALAAADQHMKREEEER